MMKHPSLASPASGPMLARRGTLATAMLVIATGAGADAGAIRLADNSDVLHAWQQTGAPTPTLNQAEDGGTSLTWTGAAALEGYRNEVSGGSANSPLRQGDFQKLTVQGDLRANQPDGAVRFLQFSATGSNDPAVTANAPGLLVNQLQMGSSGPAYHLALGDVTTGFSSLGANVGLRGMLAQKQFGATVLSLTAGTMADSWAALAGSVERARYLRDVYGGKLETPLGNSGQVFVTMQGFQDSGGGLAANAASVARAEGRSVTTGFAYQRERFGVTGEAGFSRWSEDGSADQDDQAYLFDANWSLERASLRFGHHDIGRYYASLAVQGGNGVRETYLNSNWMARDWLSLNADLRHSENALASGTVPGSTSTVNASETDALNLAATLTFGADFPGLSLLLNHLQSNGRNGTGDGNDNRQSGATLSYAASHWNSSLVYLDGRLENAGAPTSNAKTEQWQLNLGRSWWDPRSPESPAWNLTGNLGLAWLDQRLDAGGGPETLTWQLGLSAQRAGWGNARLSYVDVVTHGQPGGGDLWQRAWQVDAVHPLKGQNLLKVYTRDTRRGGSSTGADYREQVAGLQWVLVF